ncbi:glycosyltransferase [Conexibacter sp. CPCC 206217]|uniref:glycosyltransferase n=1 Tax=Conexibacter sp. CPCC 206217 TaxID=3064574 RepID=UPI002729342B|nr:glycosyltransferase [Conexibacter sp. CPCC 206217]MDO8210018.1 glycosyltransferase [Conexibacter sp. CPCC 206217]
MRILHLSPHLPFAPGGSGGATRQFHLLRRLVELGHDVTTVVPVPRQHREHVALTRAAGIRVEAVPRPASRVRETLDAVMHEPRLLPLAAAAPLPAWQVRVLWQQLRPVVARVIAETPPDLVIVELDVSGGWIADLPQQLPVLVAMHDVTAGYFAARAAATSGRQQRWFAFEQRRAGADARRWLPRARGLVCVSQADADALAALLGPAAPAPHVVPNGVDLSAFPPAGDEPDGPPTLLFTGTMNYAPNVEGIRWFADGVWPRIRARHADARLLVVGRDPTPAVIRLGELDGVTVTGSVADVAPYFGDAQLVVVPLLSGGGTRLKIVEAAASRRAIVSTSRGAEGLDVAAGRELLIADAPEEFAAQTLALLGDPARRAQLAAAARSFAERYDWRALGDRFERIVRAAADGS